MWCAQVMVKLDGFMGFYSFFLLFVLVNTNVLLVRNILLGINEVNIGPEEHFILCHLVVMVLLPTTF